MAAPDLPPEKLNGSIDWPRELAAHRRWLRTVVLARLNDHHAVDEVMQEVALATVEQRSSLQDPSRISAWLYRVTVHQTQLYLRKRHRERRRVDGYAQRAPRVESDPRGYDPLSWLLTDERERLIRHALSSLPRRDRELLLLKYTEEWSYRDIALHLGISSTAVESRLHRARARLRRELARLNVIEVKNHD